MKNKILICSLAVALAVGGLIATKTFAADNSAPPARGKILQRIAEKLNLTADQRSQIKAILSGDRDTLAPLLGQWHDARKNLRAAIRAADANEAAVRAASAKVASAEADLAVERMKLYGKIAPILTDDTTRQNCRIEQRADELVDRAIIARLGDRLDN